MTNILTTSNRKAVPMLVWTTLTLAALSAAPSARGADGDPVEITGEAIMAHPATAAILEAASLLRAGKLAEVKSNSVAEVREEWATIPEAEQRAEATRAQERAPDPEAFAADIRRVGVLVIYGESATLRIPTPDDGVSAMAFVSLEAGSWKVTGGPMTFEPPPQETAPALVGEAILDHEIGVLVIEYARRLEGGPIDAAIELLSGAARAQRTAASAQEREESDAFRRKHLPPAATLAEQIRTGGQLSFYGEKAYLNVVTHTKTDNADGSTTFESNTTALGFELEEGTWRVGN